MTQYQRSALVVCTSLLVSLGAVAFHGCSGDERSGPLADAAASLPDRSTPADVQKLPDCVLPPRPSNVPDGWQRYDGYDPCCGFYIPTASDQLPAPLRWESCGPDLHPSDVACQRIAVQRDDPYEYLSSWVSSTVASDGKQLLQISKFVGSLVWRLIVDADGNVRFGILETDSKRCTLGSGDIWQDHYVFALSEYLSSGREGFIVGDLGHLTPSFTKRQTDSLSHSVYTGPSGIVETARRPEFLLYPWSDLQSPRVFWRRDDDLSHSQFGFTSDAIYWSASSYQGVKAKIWTQHGGVRDLLSFEGDPRRGAGDLGSDGIEMVWLEGPPKPPGDGGLDTYAIMTAPYTTDPSQVNKRRLRSEVGSALGIARFQVGCGVAVRSRHDGLRIVRIADGHSWFLPSEARWNWQTVQALTCDEVFLNVRNFDRTDLVRVRLDSLGPGEDPD